MEKAVAEVVTLVTKVAVGFPLEQLHAFRSFLAQRRRIASYIPVVGRIASENGAFKTREGLGQVLSGHWRPERSLKGVSVHWKLIQPVYDAGNARSHFEMILQWKQCLVFQRTRSAIPELIRLEGSIDHRRSVPIPLLAIDAAAFYFIVSKRMLRVVTASTAGALVARQTSIEEEPLPQVNFFPSWRIVS